MSDTYVCDMCGGTFNKGRPDEEAYAECASIFGEQSLQEELSVVCDDCWVKLVNGGFLEQDWPTGAA